MARYESACRLVEAAVKDRVCSCAALAVGRGEDAHLQQVWGNVSFEGASADANTRFDMASVTKIFATTMVAFHALETGRLCLYDRLDMFLPAPQDKAAITVGHLMTHTGGLVDHIRLREAAGEPGKAIGCILSSPLAAPVGSRVIYSCMGYLLLGDILEKVYQRPLDQLAQELVFEPLGMGDTCYRPQGDNVAATERDPATGEYLRGQVHDENARFLGGVAANAGVFSTVGDCARFCQMLAQGGRQGDRVHLSPAMLAAAIGNRTPGQEQHRGLGFHLAGTEGNFMGDLFPQESFGHTGFTGTSIAIDPRTGLYVVLLTNRVHPGRERSDHLRLRRLVHNAVYAEFSREQNGRPA